jgi:hypothetical protein
MVIDVATTNFDTPFSSYYILMAFCYQSPLSSYLVHSKISHLKKIYINNLSQAQEL